MYGLFAGLLTQYLSLTYPRRSQTRSDHVTRNAEAVWINEAEGPGKAKPADMKMAFLTFR